MNIKKKIEDAKATLKKYAPQIAIIGTVAGTIAYGLYAANKNSNATVEIDSLESNPNEKVSSIDGSALPGGWEVMAAIAIDDLKRLSENDSYEVTNIDSDLFRIKEVDIEN